jgi:hypothetical protein
MFKKITAIAAAAYCAGLIVAFIPGLGADVAAGASQPLDADVATVAAAELTTPGAADIRKAVDQNLRSGSRNPKIICERSWPLYEQSCLRDGRPSANAARVVRVIATDRAAAAAAEAARNAARIAVAQHVGQTVLHPVTRTVHAKR